MPTTKPKPGMDDLVVCDCAQCGRALLAPGVKNLALMLALYPGDARDRPDREWVRLAGRPYCLPCSRPRVPSAAGRSGPPDEDGGPWQQNAVRDLEDGGVA